MIKEIYIRTKDDPLYIEGVIDFSNELEYLLTQIKVLLGTAPGDVLCEQTFGIDLEKLIFETTKNALSIETEVNEAIHKYVIIPSGVTVSTQLNFGKSNKGYDYGILDIYINSKKAIGFLINKD